MDPRFALELLGGAARRNDVLAQGVNEQALRDAVSGGMVLRPHHGTYALPAVARNIVTAASLRGQLSCVSACEWWQLKMVSAPDSLHILVPTDRHIMPERLKRLGLRDVHRADGWRPGNLVQPVEAAIDSAAWCTTPLAQLVIVDSALYQGRIDPLAVPHLTKGSERRRSWLIAYARRDSASVPESVAGAVLRAAGLSPVSQVHRDGTGRVDFTVGTRHVVEVDGYEPHSKKGQFAEDRRRDREISANRGWSLRYTYWDVMNDPRWFVEDVARITRRKVSPRFGARLAWMTTMPQPNLNRRQVGWVPS